MSSEETMANVVKQPARGQPIEVPRPPLDWGDEEPDLEWEELYYKGVVNPPYRSRKDRQNFLDAMRELKPIGKAVSNDDLMCLLGRCQCSRCDERDLERQERVERKGQPPLA